MLGTSSSGDFLVSHSNDWFTLWVCNPSYIYFNQSYSQSHSKKITVLLALIPMSENASSTGTHAAVTTDTDISGCQST